MSVLVPRPGTLLEPSWGPLGPSWRRLGPSWGPLGPLWVPPGSLRGRLRAIWGASWAVLERREAEEARTPKSFKNRLEINDFSSWGPLGSAPGGFLGRLAGLLGRLEAVKASWTDRSAIRGPLGPSWGPLGAVLACLGAFFGSGSSRGGIVSDPGPPLGTPPRDPPSVPPTGTHPPGGEGIKGKGLPFDSMTTLLSLSLSLWVAAFRCGRGRGGRDGRA